MSFWFPRGRSAFVRSAVRLVPISEMFGKRVRNLSEIAGAGASPLKLQACMRWETNGTFGLWPLVRFEPFEPAKFAEANGAGDRQVSATGVSPVFWPVRRTWLCATAEVPIGTFPRSRREQVDRAEKKELVATLNTVFKSAGVVVVAHNNGITVSQMNDLRGKMRKAGAAVKVAKNRLAMLALDGTDVGGIKDLFKGPTMIAYSSIPSRHRRSQPSSPRRMTNSSCLAALSACRSSMPKASRLSPIYPRLTSFGPTLGLDTGAGHPHCGRASRLLPVNWRECSTPMPPRITPPDGAPLHGSN